MKLALLQILPILLAVVSSFALPYGSLVLGPWSFAILFVLMYTTSLNIRVSINWWTPQNAKNILVTYLVGFLFFPLLQWVLIQLLIPDDLFRYGLIWASLSPIAIVAPLFCQENKVDSQFSMQLLLFSMILFPFTTPLALQALSPSGAHLPIWPLFQDLLLLTLLPVVLAWGTNRVFNLHRFSYLPTISRWLSLALIGVLIYTFLGVAHLKLDLLTLPPLQIGSLLFLGFVQDFAPLFAGVFLLRKLGLSESQSKAGAISLSMKNVAVTGTILLIFSPKSSLGSSTVFIAHAVLFWFLIYRARRTAKV